MTNTGEPIRIAKAIDDKPLWKSMFAVQEELTAETAPAAKHRGGIQRVLGTYVSTGPERDLRTSTGVSGALRQRERSGW
jgi:hypothetical protein